MKNNRKNRNLIKIKIRNSMRGNNYGRAFHISLTLLIIKAIKSGFYKNQTGAIVNYTQTKKGKP